VTTKIKGAGTRSINICMKSMFEENPVYRDGWEYDDNIKANKVVYAIGCSWIHYSWFTRVHALKYPDTLLINRSFGGHGNSMIIDTVKREYDLMQKFDDIYFIVCFSEVGRNIKDFSYQNPKNYNGVQEYEKAILYNQMECIDQFLGNEQRFITTSFVSNPYNNNKRIIDFCEKTYDQPCESYTAAPVHSNTSKIEIRCSILI